MVAGPRSAPPAGPWVEPSSGPAQEWSRTAIQERLTLSRVTTPRSLVTGPSPGVVRRGLGGDPVQERPGGLQHELPVMGDREPVPAEQVGAAVPEVGGD